MRLKAFRLGASLIQLHRSSLDPTDRENKQIIIRRETSSRCGPKQKGQRCFGTIPATVPSCLKCKNPDIPDVFLPRNSRRAFFFFAISTTANARLRWSITLPSFINSSLNTAGFLCLLLRKAFIIGVWRFLEQG